MHGNASSWQIAFGIRVPLVSSLVHCAFFSALPRVLLPLNFRPAINAYILSSLVGICDINQLVYFVSVFLWAPFSLSFSSQPLFQNYSLYLSDERHLCADFVQPLTVTSVCLAEWGQPDRCLVQLPVVSAQAISVLWTALAIHELYWTLVMAHWVVWCWFLSPSFYAHSPLN